MIFAFGHSANGGIFEPCIPRNWDSRIDESGFVHPYCFIASSHFAIGIFLNIIIAIMTPPFEQSRSWVVCGWSKVG